MAARLINRAYYDDFAARYDEGRGDGYHALVDELEVGFARRWVRGATVLEAGCGTGLVLARLATHARTAVGVDLSSGMLARAAGRSLPVAQASLHALPFADGQFDVVCCFKVLPHVERLSEALAELSRVVRPGGHMVLEFYNPWSLRGLVKRVKPATPISPRTDDEAVYTRYDALPAIRRALPPGHRVVDLRGVRVVTPAAALHRLPRVGRALRWLEMKSADAPGLRHLGGFLVVAVEKPAAPQGHDGAHQETPRG